MSAHELTVQSHNSENPDPAVHIASPCYNENETPRSLQNSPFSNSALNLETPFPVGLAFATLRQEEDSRIYSSTTSCNEDSDSDSPAYTTASSPYVTNAISLVNEFQFSTHSCLNRTPRSFETDDTEDEDVNNLGETYAQYPEDYHGSRISQVSQRLFAPCMTHSETMPTFLQKEIENCFTKNVRVLGADDIILTSQLADCSVSSQLLEIRASPQEITRHLMIPTEASDLPMKMENPDEKVVMPDAVTKLVAIDPPGLSQNDTSTSQASTDDIPMTNIVENSNGKCHHTNDAMLETEAARSSGEFEIPEGYWSDIGVFSRHGRCITNTRRCTNPGSSSLADESAEAPDYSSSLTDDNSDVLSPRPTPLQRHSHGIQTQMLSNILLAAHAINCAATHADNSGSSQPSKNTPNTNSGITSKLLMSSTKVQTKKRSLGAKYDGPGDNSDDEDDQEIIYNPSGLQFVQERFACPYFRNNPGAYKGRRACAGPGWSALHKVKEHLERVHRIYPCGRCQTEFNGKATLHRHQKRAQGCEPDKPESSGVEGYYDDKATSLTRRFSARDGWNEIYKILFPEETNIPSPYYTPEDIYGQERLRNYGDMLRKELPDRFCSALQEAFPSLSDPSFSEQLKRLLRMCAEQLLAEYQSQSTPSSSGSQPSSGFTTSSTEHIHIPIDETLSHKPVKRTRFGRDESRIQVIQQRESSNVGSHIPNPIQNNPFSVFTFPPKFAMYSPTADSAQSQLTLHKIPEMGECEDVPNHPADWSDTSQMLPRHDQKLHALPSNSFTPDPFISPLAETNSHLYTQMTNPTQPDATTTALLLSEIQTEGFVPQDSMGDTEGSSYSYYSRPDAAPEIAASADIYFYDFQRSIPNDTPSDPFQNDGTSFGPFQW